MADDKNKAPEKVLDPKATKPGYTEANKSASATGVLDETIDKENPNPADPYQNFQDMGTTKERLQETVGKEGATKIYQVQRDTVEEQQIKSANMKAKEAEIAAPGTFTPEEAEKIKHGLDPAKQAEVDAQTVEVAGEDDIAYQEKQAQIMNDALSNFMADSKIGVNEKRAKLRNLRNQILALEGRMDKGLTV
jgi:hypothetical protein